MRVKTFILLLIVFIPILSVHDGNAQSNQLKVDVDWATFRYNEDNSMLEIYYSFLQNDISYEKQDGQFVGITLGELRLYEDSIFKEKYAWKNQNIVPDSAQLQNLRMIIDRVAFELSAGNYECEFVVKDVNDTTNYHMQKWPLKIEKINQENPKLSNIEIASSITRAPQDHESPFYKNTLNVVPNPSLIFSKELPILFFYAEAYDLDRAGLNDGYILDYYITNSNGTKLDSPAPRRVPKTQIVNPSVEFGMMNVGRLGSGAYQLHVNLMQPDETIISSENKKFYIYQKGEEFKIASQDTSMQFQESMYYTMDSTAIDREFRIASYLMGDELRSIWNSIENLEGRKRFIFQFWQLRDPEPSTSINEARERYYKRVDHANKTFRAFTREGWSTDRGRVYILYGPPSDILRHPNEQNLYPYEIWEYDHLQSGIFFVFGDYEGYKNFRLLHSTLDGEIKDYNYMDTLKKGY